MLTDLADVCRRSGLKVVEIDGWASRGYAGQSLVDVAGVLWHHTATGRAAFASSDAPTLGMCVNGRSDLPGPLCNLVLGRSGTVYVVAAGVANHAGVGSAPGIPTDAGNHYLIGIEMESSGVTPWDWTPEQIDAAPRLGAALESGYLQGRPEDLRLQLAHFEYSSAGKIDPAGWPGGMDGLRASINACLAGLAPLSTTTTTLGDDMPTAKEIADAVWNYDYKRADGKPGKPIWILQSLDGIIAETINRTVQGILNAQVPNVMTGGKTSLGTEISWGPQNTKAIKDAVAAASAANALPADLGDRIDAILRDRLDNLTATVTLKASDGA
jgi:hypothetical protein